MANTEKIVVQVVVQGEKDLQRLEKRTGTTTKGFAKMAGGVLAAVTAFKAITGAIGSAIKSFRDFEFQMAKVKAVTGASNSDFKKLSSTAKDLGRTTFFTATQVAQLQTNFAKLGFTTSEILNAQEATLDLATATGSDLARAATVAGAAVRGFGLDASETERVVDVMAVAFTSSAMDIEKWQTSMTKVAPIAKASGFSIEDTAAMMSKLTDAGIEASIAGTSLRNILLKMQDPNSDLTKSFGKTIHSFDELVPAMKDFVKEGGSMADIMEVVDLRQAAAFEQMITSADSTVELRDALLNANGAAKEMAGVVGTNMEGAFKRFTSALEGLAINITEGFIGTAITVFLERITSVLTFINNFIDTSKSLDEITAQTAASLLKESNELQTLANRYDTLNTKISQNTSDRIEMDSILDTLKDRLGDSVVAIDKETGSLQLNRVALDDVIDRTALLANKEAIKLVHSIRNIDRAIDKETRKLNANSESLVKQERLLRLKRRTQDDITKDSINSLQVTQQMTDAEGELIDDRREGNVVNFQTAEQEKVTNSLKEVGLNLTSKITDKEAERKEKLDLLLEAGFDMATVEKLLGGEIEETTKKTVESTDATEKDTIAKKENYDAEAEIVELLRNKNILTGEEVTRITEYLNTQREKEIELQLSSMSMFIMDMDVRKKLLLELAHLTSKTIDEEDKRKDDAFQADVKRAIMSGQTAEEAMKTVVRAQIMEAVAGYISSVFQSVPFPYNLILAAGAAAAVGGVVDGVLDNFGSGGVIEEFAQGGMVNGKSHAQGGEKFAVGGRVVELEGGEAVINKRSTSMFRNQLSAMNSVGGGVKFADGGLLNMPSFSQQQFNALGQNQMMGAMSGSRQVVVVEADITNSQESVSVIQAQATI